MHSQKQDNNGKECGSDRQKQKKIGELRDQNAETQKRKQLGVDCDDQNTYREWLTKKAQETVEEVKEKRKRKLTRKTFTKRCCKNSCEWERTAEDRDR